MRTRAILSTVLALSAAAGATPAQIASSATRALWAEEIVSVAAGESSPGAPNAGRAAYGALGPIAPGEGASANLQAFSGFVHLFGPFDGSGPIVFGVSPPQGPTAGGTVVAIQGVRFQGPGTAAFGSVPVTTLPISGTRLLTVSPASGLPVLAGSVQLAVGDAGGVAAVPRGFRYVPAAFASTGVVPGGDVLVQYFGPAGNLFGYAMSLGSLPPFPFPGIAGFLQVDLLGLVFVRSSAFLADGTRTFQYATPASASLSGATVYWQPVLLPPSVPAFGNLAATSFL